MRFVPQHIPKPDYFFTGYPEGEMQSKVNNLVEIKTKEEISNMKEACIIGIFASTFLIHSKEST